MTNQDRLAVLNKEIGRISQEPFDVWVGIGNEGLKNMRELKNRGEQYVTIK